MSPLGASTTRRMRPRGRVHRLDALLGPPPGAESLLEPAEQNAEQRSGQLAPENHRQQTSDADRVAKALSARLRWRTGRSGVLLLAGLLCGVSVLLLLWALWPHAAASEPLEEPGSLGAVSPGATGGTSASGFPSALPDGVKPDGTPGASNPVSGGTDLVIYVSGAVLRPGIVRLAPGSRIYQAIAAVGGATNTAELDSINLAAPLEDGQHLQILNKGQTAEQNAPPAAGGTGSSTNPRSASGTASVGSGTVNLNTASAEQLGTLPRVGPVLAERIVQWRTEHGKFTSVEELDAVDGVGAKMLAALLQLVSV